MSLREKLLSLKIYSIILLIGPSNSGKSYFAKNYLIPQLKNYGSDMKRINVQYISSDEIRRELLGYEHDKFDREMLHVSEQAMNILYNRVRNTTIWPINAEFVVIDTLGLTEQFRENIIKVSRDNNYNVSAIVFDYKNRDDYFTFIPEANRFAIELTAKHIDRLRREVLPELNKRTYDSISRITSHAFEQYKVEVTDIKEYHSHFLTQEQEYVVIGDIHGCIEELKALLAKNNFIIEGETITSSGNKIAVLVGDLIDKGYADIETIKFIYQNKNFFKIVKGNHDNFVYKYLKGIITKNSVPENIREEYFTSIDDFEKNDAVRQMFYELIEESKEFYSHRDFIVTHAPVHRKFLGKLDPKSIKYQRTFRYSRRKDFETDQEYVKALENDLSFIKMEAVPNQPYHIFGHVAVKRSIYNWNKVGIDTGCVNGNELTSIIPLPQKLIWKFHRSGNNPKIKKTPLFIVFPREERKVNTEAELDIYEKNRIEYLCENKMNFISGTMSPANKSLDSGELESLEEGLLYFKNKGIEKVVLQPKYMGSRCTIYLHKNIENSYAVTRNGYIIKNLDLTKIYQNLQERLQEFFDEQHVELLLIDGELMPWYSLGKDLIENQFKVIRKAVKSEIDILRKTQFEEKLEELLNGKYKNSGFESVVNTKSKNDLRTEFGERDYETFKSLYEFLRTKNSLDEEEELWKQYSEQIDIFTTNAELHYKPFTLLKTIYTDKTEKTYFESKNAELYALVSDDKIVEIDLTDSDFYQKAKAYYEEITEVQNMEGVVIKPEYMYKPGIAPYLKVRNKRYLTLVYGYDYLSAKKYEKILKDKNTRNKLKTSINEFEIGKKMLEIPYHSISVDNKEFKSIATEMIVEERFEKEIDPRL